MACLDQSRPSAIDAQAAPERERGLGSFGGHRGGLCSLSVCVLKWPTAHAESRTIALLNQLLIEILCTLTERRSPEDLGLASRRHGVKLFLQDLAENGWIEQGVVAGSDGDPLRDGGHRVLEVLP